MSLAGDFREIPFSDVVQLCSQSRRRAVLVVHSSESGDELGYFYFEQGELYDARLGESEGLEAVYGALALQEGSFHLLGDVEAPQRRIFKPVSAMLLEGMRRLEQAGRAGARPATEELRLLRSPGDGSDGGQQGESDTMMSGELRGRICPTCRKRFIHGDLCPHDGTKLESAPGTSESSELTPPGGMMRPVSAPRPRAPIPSVLWFTLAGSLVVVAALGIVWLNRNGVFSSSEAPPRAAAPAAGSSRPAAATTPAAQDTGSAVRGVTDTEIRFGMAVPLTGATKELGRQMKLGVETAFAAVNDQGGVQGRQLRLVAMDDGYEPTRTAVVMQELYDKEQVFGIVGNVGTPTAVVAVPFALERKMLFYGAFTGASLLRRDPPDRYVINFRASYAEETSAVVNYLVKVRGIRPAQIAVFAQQDAFGDAGFAGVAKAMRILRTDHGKTLRVGYARNTIDVAAAVKAVVEHPVAIKAVVMVGTYRACAKFIEKMRDIDPTMVFTNVSFVGSTALAEELRLLGPKYSAGVIVTQVVPPVESHSTAVLKYKAALEKYAPGETPDYVSLEGYLAANVLVEALNRTGRELDTERLIDAFEGIQKLEVGIGAPISFGVAEHQGSHKVWGTQLDEQSKFEVLDLE